VVCLRFFTVYGPRQRPDLAIHKFTRLMAEGREIPLFGDGSTRRDYTYITDILQGVHGAIDHTAREEPLFEIVNLGESQTTTLRELVALIASAMDVEPRLRHLPAQPGDVEQTYADITRARELFGYAPTTKVAEGIPKFVEWFEEQQLAASC
jgi:UDP-glucuronate 4-epimerase